MAGGFLTPNKGWGEFIAEIGIPGTTILALLAVLAWIAIRGVPAVVNLATAIQQSTITTQQQQERLANLVTVQTTILQKVIENQVTIINAETRMIDQHQELIDLWTKPEVVRGQRHGP